MPLRSLNTTSQAAERDAGSLLSPVAYDDDASSIHTRSDQDSDSDDDQLQRRARNSRELRAHDRTVLVEEEETEDLVEKNRKRREATRRGSGLAIPNPLSMFGRRASSPQHTPSETSSDLVESEKRRARRARRQVKKGRLKESAEHGEDGELMYEMEEGGMKDGSSTGSSDREDSDELDRRHLSMVNGLRAARMRKCARWVFIHTVIAVGFVALVLLAWRLSLGRRSARSAHQLVSNGSALFAPTTILISLDGFRADFLQRGLTPRLNAFIKEGVSPKYMLPSFPSVTFPNHYTLATGLYPESHGIVGNTFWDPALQAEFYYTDPARSLDAKWWMGEPFWVTAEKQGVRTAIHMWPGSEAHILGTEPSFLDKYNGKEPLPNKIARLFEFLDKPGMEDKTADVKDMRPQLVAFYVPNVDADGHKYGPNSTEIKLTITNVDTMLDDIFHGLEQRNLTNIVNVIVVSDHGMATTDSTRIYQLEDLVDVSKIEHNDGWPLVGIRPKNPGDLQAMYDDLVEKKKEYPNFDVYLRDVNMPKRYHFSNNDRIAPLWIVPKTGWAIVTKEEWNVADALANHAVYAPRGLHGYDHEHPLMRAIFVARGPAFPHPPNSQIDIFQNIEVYNILCDSVGMVPMQNNGTLRLPLKTVGIHKPGDAPEEPADPDVASPDSGGPTKSIGVDMPIEPTESVPGPGPTPSEEAGGGGDDEDDADIEKAESGIKGFWDWFTEKVDEIWSKISGSGSK